MKLLRAHCAKRKTKDGAARRIWFDRYPAAMRFDDGPRNRQPDAEPMRLGRDEGLEQLVGDLGRNAAVCIGDLPGPQRLARSTPAAAIGDPVYGAMSHWLPFA